MCRISGASAETLTLNRIYSAVARRSIVVLYAFSQSAIPTGETYILNAVVDREIHTGFRQICRSRSERTQRFWRVPLLTFLFLGKRIIKLADRWRRVAETSGVHSVSRMLHHQYIDGN